VAALALLGAVLLVVVNASGGGHSGSGRSPFVGGDLHTLAVDPANPQRLFVGGHQAVAVSLDGGESWEPVPSLRDADAMGWGFTGDQIWVGGHPGLSHSTDGGRTFQRVTDGPPASDIHALGGNREVMYVASPAAGFLASTDGGRTWDVRSADEGRSFMGTMVVDASNRDHVVAPDMRTGAMESTDGGRTWRRLGGPRMVMSVAASGGDTAKLIAAGGDGAARAANGGATWETLDVPDGAVVIAAHPVDPNVLYAAGLSGSAARVWRSRDGGSRWERVGP
jgi:photosystem II stability/assembly factor-like uncharacterized protein